MTLADRLKQARKAAGMTQAALAAASGVKQQMVSKLERGISRATSDIVALAMAMDVSPVWLSTGEGRKDAVNSAPSYTKLSPQVLGLARRIIALPQPQRRIVEQILEGQESVIVHRRNKKPGR